MTSAMLALPSMPHGHGLQESPRHGVQCWRRRCRHSAVRNLVFKEAVRAGTKPQLQAPSLLGQTEEQPGDVLLLAPPLAETRGSALARVAHDFAVVSPFVARRSTSDGPQQLQAATAYADTKRSRRQTEARCHTCRCHREEQHNNTYIHIYIYIYFGDELEPTIHLRVF